MLEPGALQTPGLSLNDWIIALRVKVLDKNKQLDKPMPMSPAKAETDHPLDTKVYGHCLNMQSQICIYTSNKQKENIVENILFCIR